MFLTVLQNQLKNIVIDANYCIDCGYTYREVLTSLYNMYVNYQPTIFDEPELLDDIELIKQLYNKIN